MPSHEKLTKEIVPTAIASLAIWGTQQVLKNRRLRYEATHDELTDLPNLRGLEKMLAKKTPPIAFLYLDGTNQKAVNDKISHDRGDEVIIETAKIIKAGVRPYDTVFRIGGDEFLVALRNKPRSGRRIHPQEIVDTGVLRIHEIKEAYLEQNPDLIEAGYDIAVGGAIWEEGMSAKDVKSEAESAMYRVKAQQHEESGQYR